MTARQEEVAIYLKLAFPASEPTVEPEFCDINMSLMRMIHEECDPRNPWGTAIPTLISHSSILMRWVPPGATGHSYRMLHGLELMHIIGWNDKWWSQGTVLEALDPALLTSLAGNAFSAYAVGPALIAALAVLGAVNKPDFLVSTPLPCTKSDGLDVTSGDWSDSAGAED